MKKLVLFSALLLCACDDKETVWVPIDGYAPYKQQVTRDVCAEFPFGPNEHSSRERPQIDIIRDKCKALGYVLSTRKDPSFTPDCIIDPSAPDGRRMPEGYHSCMY
jgi:hypothetical protein